MQYYRKAQSLLWLHRQFVQYLYSNWKNSKCRSITKQFYKNVLVRRKQDNNGNRKDNVLNMINNQYLDHIYKAWIKNRKSVSSSWDSYFKLIYAESLKDSPSNSSPMRVSSSKFTSNLTADKSKF